MAAWASTRHLTFTKDTQVPCVSKRAVILSAAYDAHPERFINKPPVPPKIPTNSWINPPEETEAIAQ